MSDIIFDFMEENKRGGPRERAGRKPADDPKRPLTIYLEESFFEKNGGRSELAKRIIAAVKSDFVENPILARVAENNTAKVKKKIIADRVGHQPTTTPTNPISTDDAVRHPLWRENDPKEHSLAFNMKYGVDSYDELEKLQNQ